MKVLPFFVVLVSLFTSGCTYHSVTVRHTGGVMQPHQHVHREPVAVLPAPTAVQQVPTYVPAPVAQTVRACSQYEYAGDGYCVYRPVMRGQRVVHQWVYDPVGTLVVSGAVVILASQFHHHHRQHGYMPPQRHHHPRYRYRHY